MTSTLHTASYHELMNCDLVNAGVPHNTGEGKVVEEEGGREKGWRRKEGGKRGGEGRREGKKYGGRGEKRVEINQEGRERITALQAGRDTSTTWISTVHIP